MAKFYHATTAASMTAIRKEGVLRAGSFGEVFFCREPLDACKFLVIRGLRSVEVIEVELDEAAVEESYDHSESFFGCKAYVHHGDIELCGTEPITEYDFDFSKSGEEAP